MARRAPCVPPLTDRGIDGLVHRLTDGVYIPVQAKGRSALMGGEVHLVVWADSLAHDDVMLVSGLIVDGGLGPTMLVVPEGDFKRLAELSQTGGRPIYSMGCGMRPRSNSRWLPWLVPPDRLAERFGITPAMTEMVAQKAVAAEPAPSWRSDLGFLGESEVNRGLAEGADLNLFRPFPDLETAELAVLHLVSRRVVGIQVKTVGVDSAHPSATILVRALSFRPAGTTYVTVLAWLREENRFHEECLVIPSEELRGFALGVGRPHQVRIPSRLDDTEPAGSVPARAGWAAGCADRASLDTTPKALNDEDPAGKDDAKRAEIEETDEDCATEKEQRPLETNRRLAEDPDDLGKRPVVVAAHAHHETGRDIRMSPIQKNTLQFLVVASPLYSGNIRGYSVSTFNRSGSAEILTRSCSVESRWRIVTALSTRVSKSIVTQNGVPISSCRR
jgi:hypothetical protein